MTPHHPGQGDRADPHSGRGAARDNPSVARPPGRPAGGQPFLTPQRRQRTLDGLKRLLMRESQVQPLLLVFEDLHWIDTETQTLLDSLVESLPTPAARQLAGVPAWLGRQDLLPPAPTRPATASECGRIPPGLLGDDHSLGPLKPLLIARTGGNPFFLEESVRTLVETEMLVGEQGAYRLAQPLASLQMPATVQAVLAARIDRLPPEEKHVLQTAAVIGTEAPLPLLQPLPSCPRRTCTATWHICKRPSSSTRRGCSRSVNSPSNTP